MEIKEMHGLFRVLGQQMGMERIRVILPNSIDDYLNAAIVDIATQIITSNAQTVYKEKVALFNNFISPINGLSTLNTEEIKNYENSIMVSKPIMFLYDFSVKYKDIDKFVHCRLIENGKFEQTIDDYCNRPTKRYPIISVSSTGEDDKTVNLNINCGSALPDRIKIRYIRMPAVVKYDENGNGTNCDLPSHLHKSVVELAVQKFFNSVGSTSQSVKNQ